MANESSKSLRIGQIISTSSHRYRVRRVIAAGGFGITYEVENLVEFVMPGTRVKVKAGDALAMKECFREECMERLADGTVRLLPGKEKEGAFVRKAFIDEARAMVALQRSMPENMRGNLRSGLMPVCHAGIFFGDGGAVSEREDGYVGDSVYFYVMPYVVGGTLDKQLGKLQPAVVESILYRLLCALEIMHSHKDARGDTLLHRDIKPSNIMLTENDTAVLIDFGGAVMNLRSHGYTSPEHLKRRPHLTGASDLFSLGATMYEIITGHLPIGVEERMKSGQDLYENELLNENAELLKKYTEYGIQSGRSKEWGVSFLYSIDLALCMSLEHRWVSAREWRRSVFSHRSGMSSVGYGRSSHAVSEENVDSRASARTSSAARDARTVRAGGKNVSGEKSYLWVYIVTTLVALGVVAYSAYENGYIPQDIIESFSQAVNTAAEEDKAAAPDDVKAVADTKPDREESKEVEAAEEPVKSEPVKQEEVEEKQEKIEEPSLKFKKFVAARVSEYQKRKSALSAGEEELLHQLDGKKNNDLSKYLIYEINMLNKLVRAVVSGESVSQEVFDCAIRMELLIEASGYSLVRVSAMLPEKDEEKPAYKELVEGARRLLADSEHRRKMSLPEMMLLSLMPVDLGRTEWEDIRKKITSGNENEFPFLKERIKTKIDTELSYLK